MARRLSQPIVEILLRNWTVLDTARTRITKSRQLCSIARSRIQAIVRNGTGIAPSSERNLNPSNDQHDVWQARSSAKATRDESKNVRLKSTLLRGLAECTIKHSLKLARQRDSRNQNPPIAMPWQ